MTGGDAANGNRLTGWSVEETNLMAYAYVAGYSSEDIGLNPMFGQLWVSNVTAVTPFVQGGDFWAYDVPMNLGTQQVSAAIRDAAGNTVFLTNTVFMSVVTNGQYLYSAAGCVTSIVYSGTEYSHALGLAWNGQYELSSVATNGVLAESYGSSHHALTVTTANPSMTIRPKTGASYDASPALNMRPEWRRIPSPAWTISGCRK